MSLPTFRSLPKVTGLRCVLCAAVYAHGEVEYTCPRCGIEGILDVEYDHDLIARTFGPAALARERGLGALLVKDDGRNPTASFKDRASSVVVTRARAGASTTGVQPT